VGDFEVYLVLWSGGYEAPQYEVKATEEEAWALARSWLAECREDESNWIDVLRLDPVSMNIDRLERKDAHT
jgi:hypothetical protein